MSKQLQQIIVFSLLALMSYAIWEYYFDVEDFVQDKPFTKGYSVENIELRITDETGNLTAKFNSPSLIRYTDSPIVHISSPMLLLYDDGKKHWLIESDKAEYDSNLDMVGLYDNLKAKTVNDNSEMLFTAKNLLVNLKTKIATTSDGILLQQQQLTMAGQVATFDLKNEILEVNNDIKAIYKSLNK